MRYYSSWNADKGHKSKRRSSSSSPCRTGKQDNHRNENESSLRRHFLRQSGSQGCLRNAGQIDLAASAPEHSLREMLAPRDRRLYSIPQSNFLEVPQANCLPLKPSMEENGHKKQLCSSHTDLSHRCSEAELQRFNVNKQNIPRTKSFCGQDLIWVSSNAPQKSKHGVIHSMKAIITHLGLSPRASPRHSPESSRSASPSSIPSPSTPYGSPFSPPVEFLWK